MPKVPAALAEFMRDGTVPSVVREAAMATWRVKHALPITAQQRRCMRLGRPGAPPETPDGGEE